MVKTEIVDENDNVIGIMDTAEAKKKKKGYRLISVFVFNKDGKLYLPKRSKNKSYPLAYDSSAGGHLDIGESYDDCAKRELFEELGIKPELKLISKEKINFGESFRQIAFYITVSDEKININTREIEEGDFYKIDEISSMIENGEKFIPVFKHFFNKYVRDKNFIRHYR